MKPTFLFYAILLLMPAGLFAQNEWSLSSPDEKLTVKIRSEEGISFSLEAEGKVLLAPSPIALLLLNGQKLGSEARFKREKRTEVNQVLRPVIRVKNAEIKEQYRELLLEFKEKFALRFRMYNDGMAYRFETSFKDKIQIEYEQIDLGIPQPNLIYFPEEDSLYSHYERYYKLLKARDIETDRLCSLPALIDLPSTQYKILVTEANLYDYPNLFFSGTKSNSLRALFPKVVEKTIPLPEYPDRTELIQKEAPFMAETSGTRDFPWRVFGMAKNDADLLESELVFQLSPPLKIADPSWIKPGKVAWDWYNANNIYGVDFRAGINNDTYKYYIDFAAEYGLEYIILDEGWSPTTQVLEEVPDIDVAMLCKYGAKKGVGVILWVLWKPLDQQLDKALRQYKDWGVKGIKVDFMQRADQAIVNYYHRIAQKAAEYELLVDFHGAYKPAGLRRAYPNVMTREGVNGLEQNKWSALLTPEHNVTLPFIRMYAGPMDYTPGAMINAQPKNYRDIFDRPMSLGTRCHQLAMYVIYESPLQMLADSPSNYKREPECMEFLSKVPAVWDETIALPSKLGDYVVMARRSGDEWYLGAMTDENARKLDLDLSFIKGTGYQMQIYQDGINADRYASDYKKIIQDLPEDRKMEIQLAPGGGWVAHIYKR